MALLDYHHELFSRIGVYGAPNGVADLPTVGGAFTIGDIVINLTPVTQGVAMWQCVTPSPAPTFTSIASAGGRVVRSTVSPAVITAADKIVLITTAGSASLPAGNTFPAGEQITIKNMSGGNVVITPISGLIDGNPSLTLATLGQADITSDGTNYYRIGS